MKKLLAVVLAMVMVLSAVPFALADNETLNETPELEAEDQTETELNETEVKEEAGITPDSPLWGIDRAIERISLALTFGKAAKAKKGLEYARERLMEVQAMQAEKKLDKAEKAKKAFGDLVDEAEENAAELGNGDAEQELEQEVEIEKKLDQTKKLVEQIGNISLRIQGLTLEQQNQIKAMLQNMTQSASEFKVKIQANKNKIKIKIKAEKGATDDEIKALEDALKQGMPLAKVKIVKKGEGVIKERGKDKKESKDEAEDEDEAENQTEDHINETDESEENDTEDLNDESEDNETEE